MKQTITVKLNKGKWVARVWGFKITLGVEDLQKVLDTVSAYTDSGELIQFKVIAINK